MASLTTRRSSTDVSAMKARIKELEDQVTGYRKRLDELRKAKNTTIHKTQREVVEVTVPQLGQRTNDAKIAELQRKLGDLKKQKDDEIDEINKRHKAELSKINSGAKPAAGCGHEPQIERLEHTVLTLEGAHAAVLLENTDLTEKINSLEHHLSVKEASWCENEEKLKQQLQVQWGEKYKEWIEKTEAKIEDLQQTNILLRGYLKKQKPDD